MGLRTYRLRSDDHLPAARHVAERVVSAAGIPISWRTPPWAATPCYSRSANRNAEIVTNFLTGHPNVSRVYYPALLAESDPACAVARRQCNGVGTTFSFDVRGGEAEAFAVLNALQVFKLAVGLGSTESLVCHPATTVHSGVPRETRERLGISDATILVSVSIEHVDDTIADLTQALARIG